MDGTRRSSAEGQRGKSAARFPKCGGSEGERESDEEGGRTIRGRWGARGHGKVKVDGQSLAIRLPTIIIQILYQYYLCVYVYLDGL